MQDNQPIESKMDDGLAIFGFIATVISLIGWSVWKAYRPDYNGDGFFTVSDVWSLVSIVSSGPYFAARDMFPGVAVFFELGDSRIPNFWTGLAGLVCGGFVLFLLGCIGGFIWAALGAIADGVTKHKRSGPSA